MHHIHYNYRRYNEKERDDHLSTYDKKKYIMFVPCSRGLTDESEILKFLQHGTLVGLLPVPHPILIRKYQANSGTTMWFRTYMWGVIYLR